MVKDIEAVNLAQVTEGDLLAGQDRAVDVEMIKLIRDVPAHIELEQIQHTSMHEIDIRITRGLHASRSSYSQQICQISCDIVNHPIIDCNQST